MYTQFTEMVGTKLLYQPYNFTPNYGNKKFLEFRISIFARYEFVKLIKPSWNLAHPCLFPGKNTHGTHHYNCKTYRVNTRYCSE